jgi:hypothetical protein
MTSTLYFLLILAQVLFYDPESGEEPMGFHVVFLYSQALEGITLSMVSCYIEIFCLLFMRGGEKNCLS